MCIYIPQQFASTQYTRFLFFVIDLKTNSSWKISHLVTVNKSLWTLLKYVTLFAWNNSNHIISMYVITDSTNYKTMKIHFYHVPPKIILLLTEQSLWITHSVLIIYFLITLYPCCSIITFNISRHLNKSPSVNLLLSILMVKNIKILNLLVPFEYLHYICT